VTAVLSCENLAAGYQRQPVVRKLNLEVSAGEIVAILGPNGAGKTTSLLTMAGLLSPISGTVRLAGRELNYSRPHLAARSGIALVPDDKCLFTTLTVAENISFGRRGKEAVRAATDYFPALEPRLSQPAGVLSGGEQQMLALARAFVARPKIMLIDELSMGLAPLIVEGILAVVRRVASEQGTAVVLVEQHVHMALQTADRALVLAHGDVVLEQAAAALRDHPEALQASYFGTST
jgi:branched-chain amino acid transport system ATP-binding protein